jgi:hypothetical protein
MRTPSIVLHGVERDTYLVRDDFGGQLGLRLARETDAEKADRATPIFVSRSAVTVRRRSLSSSERFA